MRLFDNLTNSVRVFIALNTIEDHLPDRILAGQGFTPRLEEYHQREAHQIQFRAPTPWATMAMFLAAIVAPAQSLHF